MDLPDTLSTTIEHADLDKVESLCDTIQDAIDDKHGDLDFSRADANLALALALAEMVNSNTQHLDEQATAVVQKMTIQTVAEAILNYARLSDEASALLN